MFDIENCPSFIYREKIDRLCKSLEENAKIKYFFCHIIFNNRQTFLLSNTYQLLNSYYADELYKKDYVYDTEIIGDKNYYICCGKNSSVSDDITNILEGEFNIYKSYYTVKKCPECIFIFGAATNKKVDNRNIHYATTISEFDDFCCFFLNNMVDVIKENNVLYSDALIFSDALYREKVIKNKFQNKLLTKKERQCLQLIARGKKSSEIAYILGNSITTIDFHKKNIMAKMNARHMAQAVMEALKRGEVGSLNNWHEKGDVMTLNSLLVKKDDLVGV